MPNLRKDGLRQWRNAVGGRRTKGRAAGRARRDGAQ